MRRLDEMTIHEFNIDVRLLMENAGHATATLARQLLGDSVVGKRICCLVGGGNNGGDGMVAARHLANWGASVDLVTGASEDKMRELPLQQLQILARIGLKPLTEYDMRNYDLLITGLIGYGIDGNPRDKMASIIRDANKSGRPILAVDVPSGMNATTGEPYDPCIRATATLTLALPKTGFLESQARKYLGELYLADISIPRLAYERVGQRKPLFEKQDIVKL